MDQCIPHCPYYDRAKCTAKGTGLGTIAGKEDPSELDPSSNMWCDAKDVE